MASVRSLVLVLTGITPLLIRSIIECPTQPANFGSLLNFTGADLQCVFRTLANIYLKSPKIIESNTRIWERFAVPDNQVWSHCQMCAWSGDGFLVFRANDVTSDDSVRRIHLSSSLWGEFFFNFRNDQLYASVVSSSYFRTLPAEMLNTSFYIDRPVYILPMITLHAGHMFIDVIEQVYHSMMENYGMVRRDVLIVLDVASEDERRILQEKIVLNCHSPEVDTFGSLLSLFTDLPIVTMELFHQMRHEGNIVLFEDLHLGLDNSDSFYHRGYEYHPRSLPSPTESAEIKRLSEKYRAFQSFIVQEAARKYSKNEVAESTITIIGALPDLIEGQLGSRTTSCTYCHFHNLCNEGLFVKFWGTLLSKPVSLSASSAAAAIAPRVLVIQREKNRSIQNLHFLIHELESRGAIVSVNELLAVPFSEQPCLFASADILVAVAGTAVHNMLFMRRGTTVIVLMQPSWCPWSWMYTNQAILLGITALVYCPDGKGSSSAGAVSRNINNSTDGDNDSDCGSSSSSSNNSSSSNSSMNGIDIGWNEDDTDTEYFHWTRKLWLQGPRMMKSENVTVEPATFAEMAKAALSSLSIDRDTGKRTNVAPSEHVRYYYGKKYNVRIVESVLSDEHQRSHDQSSQLWSDTAIRSQLSSSAALMELFISEIEVHEVSVHNSDSNPQQQQQQQQQQQHRRVSGKAWKLAIMGELAAPTGRLESMVQSMPHISVCVVSVGTSAQPWCYPIDAFNYYSHVFLTVSEPVHLLHLWVQVSIDGGKIKGSDMFVAVDARLPSGSLGVHKEIIGLTVSTDIEIEMTPNAAAANYGADTDRAADGAASGSGERSRGPSGPVSYRETIHFARHMTERYSLQRSTMEFCRLYEMTEDSCAQFAAHWSLLAYRMSLIGKNRLPAPQYLPTPKKPFVFIHIEKTGGTTLREFIAESAERLGLKYFIPCHGGVHCVTLSLGDDERAAAIEPGRPLIALENISVVAGHFFWNVWEDLPSFSLSSSYPPSSDGHGQPKRTLSTAASLPPQKEVPSCIIMGRNPIDRSISYYYQRCYESPGCVGYKRRINELTPDELEVIAVREREAKYRRDNVTLVVLDEGIEDAGCRALANAKATTGLVAGRDEVNIPPPLTSGDVDKALGNVENCLVGILEQWEDTKKVINFWYPWIDFTNNAGRRKMHIYSGKETSSDLRDDLRQVLLRVTMCDMQLYTKMLRLFRKELAVLNANAFGS